MTDQHAKSTITEPDTTKTLKTDENHAISFSNLPKLPLVLEHKHDSFLKHNNSISSIELKILGYYGHKEDVYDSLMKMS